MVGTLAGGKADMPAPAQYNSWCCSTSCNKHCATGGGPLKSYSKVEDVSRKANVEKVADRFGVGNVPGRAAGSARSACVLCGRSAEISDSEVAGLFALLSTSAASQTAQISSTDPVNFLRLFCGRMLTWMMP